MKHINEMRAERMEYVRRLWAAVTSSERASEREGHADVEACACECACECVDAFVPADVSAAEVRVEVGAWREREWREV